MEYKGIDTTNNVTSYCGMLKAAGYSFVMRYYNTNNPSKNLSLSEAEHCSREDIWIVSMWENGFPTSPSYFSKSRGESDAHGAFEMGLRMKQPFNTPIYFTVDYDAAHSDLPTICSYFAAIRNTFKAKAVKDGHPGTYLIGVYGSAMTCNYVHDKGLADFKFLSLSTGWADYSKTGMDIVQGPRGGIFPLDHDTDISFGHSGGWKVPGF